MAEQEEDGPQLPVEDVVHLVNRKAKWELRETVKGRLTDGRVSEDLQRDRVRQIVQWLRHYPERLPEMEALTLAGQAALSRARGKGPKESDARW
jgi:hypothetical protein